MAVDYRNQVGEALMSGFIKATTEMEPTIPFGHELRNDQALALRRILLDPAYFGIDGSAVFHDDHRRVRADQTWRTAAEAQADGRRPCGVCRPS
jgi:hypothetical protein